MAIESNELNVMGQQIQDIENKIKELTNPNKVQKAGNEEGDGQDQQADAANLEGDPGDQAQEYDNMLLFDNLSQYLSGQILDDVKRDAQLLLEIQETKQVVESVLVKHLNFDPSHITDFSDIPAFTQTFRIYRNTKFQELKNAACKFWDKLEQEFEMTDEYFNNLDTFQGTVCDFYAGSYTPLNQDNMAIVYLYKSNLQQTEINQLQYQSIIIKGKTEGEDEEGGDSLKKNDASSKNQIDVKVIVQMLPGLKTYQEPKLKELRPFIEKINPNKRKLNSMIILILGLFVLGSTLSIMLIRYGNSTLYELLKQVQLFTIASVAGSASSDNIDLKPAVIETRRQLVDYFESYVPANFFYEEALLDRLADMGTAEKEYASPK